jgi:LPXTG-site transpeptidase (sortase) family protein
VGVSAAVLKGIDSGTLRNAVGHIPGSALPGQAGRVALAGHRDTFFRGLRHIKVSDEIRLISPAGEHRYQVLKTEIVKPHRVDVIAPAKQPLLTLITCYPFSYVGTAPLRFVVHARRVESSAPSPTPLATRQKPPRKQASRLRPPAASQRAEAGRPAVEGSAQRLPAEDAAAAGVQQAADAEEPLPGAERATDSNRAKSVAGVVSFPFRKAFGWLR